MTVENLEKRGALQILAYLYGKERVSRSDLRKNIDAAMETIYSTLKALKTLGLIEEKVIRSFPKRVDVYLNEKGVSVAKRILEIKNILEHEE